MRGLCSDSSELESVSSSGHGSNCCRIKGKGIVLGSLVGANGRAPEGSLCRGRDRESSLAIGTQ